MKIRIVTHLGGSPATSACDEVLEHDSFSALKDSVTCPACLKFIRVQKGAKGRYKPDYNPDKGTWGAFDTADGKFVSSTTTRAGAKIQCGRMSRKYYW